MRVSLNLIKKYVDLPKDLTYKQIAYDLTLRTVEVESVTDTSLKFDNIVVGKILSVEKHPDADLLRVCMVDIGEDAPVQIVCGGSNLYKDEMVVVSKPGAKVYWHGEGEPVEIKETKMRGVSSYGMICAAEEVYLDGFFKSTGEREIVDLAGYECYPGENVSEALGLADIVIEIDNKSLTNRPDLWGHYGIARELSAIYDVPLKKLESFSFGDVPKYNVEILDTSKCNRYVGIEIDGVKVIDSPLWMKSILTNCGMRPINAIVDITNYVMIAIGQPTHAFDKTHVKGEKIIVRNAVDGEELELLDNNCVSLTKDDLVICDSVNPIALAGIKGGLKDSILDDTTGIVLEVANFSAGTIRKSGKRFDEKTDAAMRYEKALDTEKVSDGVNLALSLFKEIFPESKIVKYNDVYPVKTERCKISLSQEWLDVRLGKKIDSEVINKILTSLGYDVEFDGNNYSVVVPVWRSTGDVSMKDDVLGDIARLLSFISFEAKPLPVKFNHAVIQLNVLLERRIKEYLAYRCGFNEIFTYPWIDEKYIKASGIDTNKLVKLATPPAPELAYLRGSLIPGMLESISKNLRYYDSFRLFEMAQVYEKGEYHESSMDETLPIQRKHLTCAIVGKDAKEIFYQLKGIISKLARYTHMEELELALGDKPSYADINAHMDIKLHDKIIGQMGLLSIKTMMDAKIKRTNVAVLEIDFDSLKPYASRTNEFVHLPLLPLVEKDLSLIMDENVTWEQIESSIKSKVKEVIFLEEYYGDQIPEGKKSIVLRIKLENESTTMTTDEINHKIERILSTLEHTCGAKLREE